MAKNSELIKNIFSHPIVILELLLVSLVISLAFILDSPLSSDVRGWITIFGVCIFVMVILLGLRYSLKEYNTYKAMLNVDYYRVPGTTIGSMALGGGIGSKWGNTGLIVGAIAGGVLGLWISLRAARQCH